MTLSYCDLCDERPGTHTCIAYGIETVLCDQCGDREPDEDEAEPADENRD